MVIDQAGMGLVTVPPSLVADLQDELMTAGTELERLQRLLIDAVTQLSAHFSNAVNSQIDLPPSQERDALLTDMRRAMTALQFEDMASQLITHSRRRLSSVAECLGNLALSGDEEGREVEWVVRPCPVAQRVVDAGSVELF
jgi:molecular chaperone DnaK (HSP70)